MSLEFASSNSLSMGIELELQLINLSNSALSQDAGELLRRLDNVNFPGAIKPEVTQSMIEINSSIHTNLDSMKQEIMKARDLLVTEANKIDIGIAGGGAHPFQRWKDTKIFPIERMENMYLLYGYLIKRFTVFAQHIHVGCESGDQAIKLCHLMIRYLPHFIALSASSPYYQEADTDFDSSRQNIVLAFPNSGTLPTLKNWKEFDSFYNKLIELQVITCIKDLYWDIRPKPEFGTVEIRICDTPLHVIKSIELAAYAQSLSSFLINQPFPDNLEDLYLTYKYNRFQASKFGMNGIIIDPVTKNKTKIYEDILQTIQILQQHTDKLGLNSYIESLQNSAALKSNDAQLLRAEYLKCESFPVLVKKQVELWNNS